MGRCWRGGGEGFYFSGPRFFFFFFFSLLLTLAWLSVVCSYVTLRSEDNKVDLNAELVRQGLCSVAKRREHHLQGLDA